MIPRPTKAEAMTSFGRISSVVLSCAVCSCSPRATIQAAPPGREPRPQQLSEPIAPGGPSLREAAEADGFARQLALEHPHALAFRVVGRAIEFADGCQLYTPPPTFIVSMDGTPMRATKLSSNSSTTVALMFPGIDFLDRRAISFATLSWDLPAEVLHGPGCAGVTHATVSLRQGSWMDPGPSGESPCLSEHEFDHPNDALATTCPREVLALELGPIRLAPAGAESQPILEPMVRIAGGVFEGERIETFWIDRDEVGEEEYARCVRSGECAGDPAVRSSPFVSGPAQRTADEATVYCGWVGKRLPTLREWQWVARGREEDRKYPWGEELPDASRANAVDKAHALFVPTKDLDPGDPRMQLGWVEQRWAGMWTHVPVERGAHPLGDSRDGVRDLIGNVQEAVRLDAPPNRPSNVYVGGGSRHYLPDHHNVALTGDPAEDETKSPFRERALRPLSSEGYSPDFDLGGSFGSRCATEHQPESQRLQAERLESERGPYLRVPGMRRFADAKQACAANDSSDRQWRLPRSPELAQLAPVLEPVPHWTEPGDLWQEKRTRVRTADARTTARAVCIPEKPRTHHSSNSG